jgi:hypothetical protein
MVTLYGLHVEMQDVVAVQVVERRRNADAK